MNTTPHSAKTKSKIANALKGIKHNEDRKLRIAAGMLKYHERVRKALQKTKETK